MHSKFQINQNLTFMLRVKLLEINKMELSALFCCQLNNKFQLCNKILILSIKIVEQRYNLHLQLNKISIR